jgi:aminoglycoside/choline kinase family phosphotransferase
MADRLALHAPFLAAAGWEGADISLLAGDASFRKYYRVRRGGEIAVLMDAPPPQEDVRPFTAIARHLEGMGLSAPRILHEDAEQGFLLIEDLGDDTYTRLLADGRTDETVLYLLATDVLIDIHRRADAIPAGLAPYDANLLWREASLFTDWYLPAVTSQETDAGLRDSFEAAWRQVFPAVLASPQTLVLRDYHVDNLLLLEGREGVARCGLLDFQDAVAGSVAYDFISLVEDARRDVPDAVSDACRMHYLDAFPALDRDGFDAACRILAAQRHTKVIGIFTRLCMRDGKPDYLRHMPRLWRLLEAALAHPSLDPVARWFDTHITKQDRITPRCP